MYGRCVSMLREKREKVNTKQFVCPWCAMRSTGVVEYAMRGTGVVEYAMCGTGGAWHIMRGTGVVSYAVCGTEKVYGGPGSATSRAVGVRRSAVASP